MFVIIAKFQLGNSYWNATNSTWGGRRFATEYATEELARLARFQDVTTPTIRRGELVHPVVEVVPA